MKYKKKIIIYILSFTLVISLVYTGIKINNKIEWQISKNAIASAGFPYQIGLTSVVVIKCFTTGDPPICEGGTLCYTKDAATCSMYSDISGVPAGGMGSKALFPNIALARAGVKSGGQLIAGGISPVLMDSGVLAGPGGCYNCIAKADWGKKIKEKTKYLFRYVIAGFKK